MLEITSATQTALNKNAILPQLVLEIEGVDAFFGAVLIQKYILVGDADLYVGGNAPGTSTPWVIGGLYIPDNQHDVLSMEGTGSTISQQLYQDKGSVSSVSSMKLKLIDKDQIATQLITPGNMIADLLGARAKVYLGFQNTGFPEDFIEIFRGMVDDIESGPGDVTINIAHPDQDKRQDIFLKRTGTTTSSMDNVVTTIPMTDADTIFLPRVNGPSGALDSTISYYVRIDDEIIKYEDVDATGLLTCTRAQLGTVADSHDSGAEVNSFYVLESSLVDCALKLMLSGTNGSYVDDVEVESINVLDGSSSVANSLYFTEDVVRVYNLQIGDFVTISSATNGANNQTLLEILDIVSYTNDTSYIVVDASPDLVDESSSPAVVSFRSQYDSWGQGLAMDPRDVDIEEHLRWDALILSSFEYRFYLKDTINGKEFLEKEIYTPYGAYSIPRKGRSSMGYHLGPIPSTATIKILNQDNITHPETIRLKRTISRNFYNTVVFQYDLDSLEDKYLSGVVYEDEDSRNRIEVGTKTLTIPSSGIRSDLSGLSKTEQASEKFLNRYKFAAEYFEQINLQFKVGFNIEVGDIVIFDPTGLQVSNTLGGDRNKEPRYFEVQNKSLDMKTGQIKLSILDTSFNINERYGLISPSSVITSGTADYAIIEDSFGALYPGDEARKWEDYVGLPVRVHSADYSFDEEVVFTGFDTSNPYKMMFETSLSMAVSSGWIIDIPEYASEDASNLYKIIHAHLSPLVAIVSGASGTEFDVDISDVDKFQVGFTAVIHDADFGNDSGEVKIADVTGTTITVDSDMGFTPSGSMFVRFLGFSDGESSYRWI